VRASTPAPAPEQQYSRASLKDDYYPPVGGTQDIRGVWSEGYYDYEKHKNLAPGRDANPTRRSVSGGVMSGIDWSRISLGPVMQGFQIGVLSGYNSTKNRYSDTVGLQLQDNNSLERVRTQDARETIEGAFVGVYGAWIHGRFSLDGAVKVDLYDIEQTKIESLIDCANTPTLRVASTSMTNTAVASNAYYRFDLSRNHWIEPTAGVRYTHVDYGGNAPALGVKDGDAFRVQGGIRFGMRYMTPDSWIWTTTLAALLYSDVSLSGLVINPAFPGLQPIPLVDEGKLRVMGVLENKVDLRNGYILYSDLDVRGGDDVFGFGARAGVRYQW
jgi:hypothetical protein